MRSSPEVEMPESPREIVVDPPAPDVNAQYRVLPEQVHVADTVPLVDTTVARDPRAGRDTETEFLLRYGA